MSGSKLQVLTILMVVGCFLRNFILQAGIERDKDDTILELVKTFSLHRNHNF